MFIFQVVFSRRSRRGKLSIDGTEIDSKKSPGTERNVVIQGPVFVGGLSTAVVNLAGAILYVSHSYRKSKYITEHPFTVTSYKFTPLLYLKMVSFINMEILLLFSMYITHTQH